MAAGDVLLGFNHSVIPQDRYYWCGPATMQVLLSVRGINVSEFDMATALGTTVDGTDTIAYLTRELNERLGNVYVTRTVADPPSQKAKDLFWADIVHSIDCGYGIGANIIAPASNPPRPVRGETLAYSGFPVYHYSGIVGYNKALRQAAWFDTGFKGFFAWVDVDQILSVIAGKGYTAAANAELPGVFNHLSDAQQNEMLVNARQLGQAGL